MAVLSKLDLQIFREYCKLKEKEEITSWQLMKRIYNGGNNAEHQLILWRLKKLANYGFFIVYKNGKNHNIYGLIQEKVILKQIKLPNRTGQSICLDIGGKWQIIEL